MRILRLLFAVYIALVLIVTMWPSPETTDAPGWAQSVLDVATDLGIPLTLPVLEASSNVVMFVPFGVLGLLLIRHRVALRITDAESNGPDGRTAVAGGEGTNGTPTGVVARPRAVWIAAALVTVAGLVMSALIETTQLLIPGRVSTFQDIVVNTLGALLGVVVVAVILVLRQRGSSGRSRAARVSSRA